TPVIDLTEQISYSPFDNCESIIMMKPNYNEDNLLLINLITENLRVREIRYSTLPIEYLPTSKEGIMQYQRGHPSGGGNTKVWCTFLDCDIHKYYSTCQ
ncbi:20803_t:CDS:2, partial [Gigaspora margarita]